MPNHTPACSGHIKGIQRLHRRLKSEREKYLRTKAAVSRLLLLADAHGFGDHPAAVAAAASIGWVRMTDEEKAEAARKIGEMQ